MNYNIKLKKNSLHVPKAAKLIIEDKNTISSFIFLSPIINVNSKTDINIYTDSTIKQSILETKYSENIDIKKVTRNNKKLKAQLNLGLNIDEFFAAGISKSKIEALKLEKSKVNPYIGGGF
ncbi:MAG: hypothetical protein HRT99_00530 [Mycoplasmatales bacterium]|nr:hypothetical protein [Mycoplasmatales bacterium]